MAALDALQPPHLQKKINTIFALVDAPIRPQRGNDWGNARHRKPQTLPHEMEARSGFAAALDAVYKAALRSHNQRALDAVRLAASRLQPPAPAAAGTAIRSMAADDPSKIDRPARGPGHPEPRRPGDRTEGRDTPSARRRFDQWRRDAERRRGQVDQMLDDMDEDDGADDLDEDTDA